MDYDHSLLCMEGIQEEEDYCKDRKSISFSHQEYEITDEKACNKMQKDISDMITYRIETADNEIQCKEDGGKGAVRATEIFDVEAIFIYEFSGEHTE